MLVAEYLGGCGITEPETRFGVYEPEVEVQEISLEDGMRVAIIGAGGHGRVTLDVLLAAGYGDWILGFYDDAHPMVSGEIRGVPILGDVGMLKSLLSVEDVYVVVAITGNRDRLRVANSVRALGGSFATAVHPAAYVSDKAVVGDGSVVAAGAVVHPDAAVGSHCFLGPASVVERDAVVGAGVWVSGGAVVGPGAGVGARAVLGQNASVGRKASVEDGAEIGALQAVRAGGVA